MYNNIIVNLSSAELKRMAREVLHRKWMKAIGASFIFMLAMLVPAIIITLIFDDPMSDPYLQATSQITNIYTLMVTGPLTFGFALYMVSIFRRQQTSYTMLFSGFENLLKTAGLYLFQYIFITLWSFLFIIPGIIASIRYSQAFFIMIDHPEYTVRQCVNESKRMMFGNKMTYFSLTLSFIGWGFVALLPYLFTSGVLLLALPEDMGAGLWMFAFILITLSLIAGISSVAPYMICSYVAMYEVMSGRVRPIVGFAQGQPYADTTVHNVEETDLNDEAKPNDEA